MALVGLLLTGCGALGGADEPAPNPGLALVVETKTPRVAPTNIPALRALQNALAEGADDLARRLVETLRRRPLTEDERALVESIDRALIGRELMRGLHIDLVVEVRANGPVLFVAVDSSLATEVTLELPPIDLEHLRVAIDAEGLEGRDFGTQLLGTFESVVVPPLSTTSIELGPCAGRLGRALAARDRWSLLLRAGRIRRAGEEYPTGRIPSARCEFVTVADDVAGDVLDADALADRFANALLDEETVRRRDLLRAAVRVPAQEREAALRALAPVLRTFADAPARVGAELAPALRWLTRAREPGTDVAEWARWITQHVAELDARAANGPDDGLDLPTDLEGDPAGVGATPKRGRLDLP